MIKVLLVDDEQFIRQGLRALVNWEEYGYHIVAEAKNGMEAINILDRQAIDLVFVDIKMPGMTGLELISYIREKIYRPIHFVILTGYADFQYAKTAVSLDVTDYMLKPIQEEELKKLLVKLNEIYLREQKERQEKYDFHITRVVQGKYTKENLKIVKEYLPEEAFKYVSIEFDKWDQKFDALKQWEKAEKQRILIGYLQELTEKDSFHVVPLAETEEGIYGAALIMTASMYYRKNMCEEEFLEYLQKWVNRHFEERVQIYVGQQVDTVEMLSESFQSTRVVRCLYGMMEDTKVMSIDDGGRKPTMGIKEDDVEELLDAVRCNDSGQIGYMAEVIFSQIRKADMNMEMIHAGIYHILYRLMEMAKEFDNETNQQEILEYIGKESFNKLMLLGNTKEVTNFFLDYAGYLEQVRNEESKNVFDKVDDYVKEHYMEKLSLKSLGELYYVNNVYLGQLYKKKYGIAFRDYLNQLRVEKAQELLIHTNMRIYAIAEEVGFGKVDYFIEKFVQMNHMTPNQYRMHHKPQDEKKFIQ